MIGFQPVAVCALTLAGAVLAAPRNAIVVPRADADYLDAHNSFRALHGANPLTWSSELALKAQNWANGCVFEHGSVGENLAAGTGNYGPRDAIKGWTDESVDYDPQNPQYSHFTQVVWKSTTELGCAVATCPAGAILSDVTYFYVCEYAPPGNVIGQFADNVQK